MLVSMTKTIAAPAPESRFLAKARVLVRFPSGSKFSVGAKTMTMPVNALSNSSIVTFTLPRAGSFMQAWFPRNPQSTTKWLRFQWMMQGKALIPLTASSPMR